MLSINQSSSLELDELQTDDQFIRFCIKLGEQGILNIPEKATAQVEDISGNINRVRRIRFLNKERGISQQSFILKTLPFKGRLEKYPDIMFPESRLTYECLYYQAVQNAAQQLNNESLNPWMPTFLHVETTQDSLVRTLVMSDLSPAMSLQDLSIQNASVSDLFFKNLGHQLGLIHGWSYANRMNNPLENPSALKNRPYVLTQPFSDSDDLFRHWEKSHSDSWRCELQNLFLAPQKEQLYLKALQLTQDFKSDPFNVLTHGDLHADSLFVQEGHPVVIDAELCDRGAAWFDTGMVIAHLWMLSPLSAQPLSVALFLEGYQQALDETKTPVVWSDFLEKTVQLAGFEVIRRILGIANLHYLNPVQAKKLLTLASHHLLQTPHLYQPDDLAYKEII